ncbi:MAG: phosphateNa+ [Geobacteraceae bacterium]|nr:MAG: phosphateNa+ [Geobacteraceae bacterium]
MPQSFLWEALGGLGLFILGMKFMSEGLQKLAGERLRQSLEKTTGNRLSAALMGSCLASLLQSSSAASILVVGFVNAGLISLYQALGVLVGTGIGTTLAIQFIAFKVSFYALPVIFFGVIFKFFGRRRRWVYVGDLLLGAGLVFLGLQIMETGFVPLTQTALYQGFQNRFFSWRISAVLSGAVITFLIQSSSAATGVIIALAGSGLLGYEVGVAMVVGEVLGTSLIAVIASINGTLAAKRTALVYFIINTFAVVVVLLFFPLFLKIVHLISPGEAEFTITNVSPGNFPPGTRPNIARHLANAHTVFSVLSAMVFLPLLGFFTRSATVIVPGREGGSDMEPRTKYIDRRVVNTPTIALLQAKNELKRMAGIARSMFDDMVEQFYRYDAKRSARIQQKEEALDILQRDISGFLVLISRQPLDSDNSMEIPIMLHIVNNLEHLGDQTESILECLSRKKEERILFSNAAMSELKALAAKVAELVHLSLESLDDRTGDNLNIARTLKDEIINMQGRMNNNHIKRMTSGKCTVISGLVYGDIISAFNKIAEYAFNIMKTEKELF